MRCQQRKNSKKVAFSEDSDVGVIEEVVQKIQALLHSHGVPLNQEASSTRSMDSDSNEITPIRTNKTFKKEANSKLFDLQKLLANQLVASLEVIGTEIFDDPSEEVDVDLGIKVLVIFHKLLSSAYLNDHNSSKVLRWIHTLTVMNTFQLCMELSSVFTSIKKKMLKLGYLILSKFKNVDCSAINPSDEEQFKRLVCNLIKAKQKEVSDLKYEMCRLCEKYLPLNKLPLHLIECERTHQVRYNQGKLEQKGAEILSVLSKLHPENQERLKMQQLFGTIFDTFDGKNAILKIKSEPNKASEFILQCQFEHFPTFDSLVDVLKKYSELFKQEPGLKSLSDQDSKKVIKSNRKIVSIRGIGHSSSSIEAQNLTFHASHSEKTINSDTDSNMRYRSCRLSDFQILKEIGRGSYSEVYLVRKKNTKDLFAMKVIEFEDLNEERLAAFRKQQKVYKSITGDFNVKLYYSFREDNLYFFILDFGCGGSFRTLLQKEVYLDQPYAKIYLANLVLAIQSIHSIGIIHRDLKPDNIVISEDGHLTLTDFNLSKLIKEKQIENSNTFFGTPDYIAPEVIKGEPATESIDWFSLGIIAYEMIIGVTPFTDFTKEAVFDNILRGEIEWPEADSEEDQISPDYKDLIIGLLEPDPQKRLGSKGSRKIRDHPFFKGVKWDKLADHGFFYVPEIPNNLEEDSNLLEAIQYKKRELSIEFIPSQENIVRYDVLKVATNNIVRSRRSSRFKIEKQLQDLKSLTSSHMKALKQRSHNSFNWDTQKEDNRASCHNFLMSENRNQ